MWNNGKEHWLWNLWIWNSVLTALKQSFPPLTAWVFICRTRLLGWSDQKVFDLWNAFRLSNTIMLYLLPKCNSILSNNALINVENWSVLKDFLKLWMQIYLKKHQNIGCFCGHRAEIYWKRGMWELCGSDSNVYVYRKIGLKLPRIMHLSELNGWYI